MHTQSFFKWASSSLAGNVTLCEVLFAIPLTALFIVLNYSQGTLTVQWALHIAIDTAAIGAVLGAVTWFTVTLPLLKRKAKVRPALKQGQTKHHGM